MQQYPEALKTALIMIDKEICSSECLYFCNLHRLRFAVPPIRSGSTALVALVADNTVYIVCVPGLNSGIVGINCKARQMLAIHEL